MTRRAEGFLDRREEGLGGGGSTNLGRLLEVVMLCLRSSRLRDWPEEDPDLSRLLPDEELVVLGGRDERCVVHGGGPEFA